MYKIHVASAARVWVARTWRGGIAMSLEQPVLIECTLTEHFYGQIAPLSRTVSDPDSDSPGEGDRGYRNVTTRPDPFAGWTRLRRTSRETSPGRTLPTPCG